MKTMKKRLDCVRLKDRVHAALMKEYAGLPDAEVRRRVRLKLARSRGPVADVWRALGNSERARSRGRQS